MIFRLSCFIILLVMNLSVSVCAEDCSNIREIYDEWNRVLEVLIKYNHAEELTKKSSEKLIIYAKTINEAIINEQIDYLIANIDRTDFRYYHPGDKIEPENIAHRIHKELKSKQGIYYDLFDKVAITNKYQQWAYGCARYYDIRRYLKEYRSKIKWRVFYLPDVKAYEVWFSIPEFLVRDFDYFYYRIKEKEGKYMLVGF